MGNQQASDQQRYRVVVWGTGNVGRPALRAVLAHDQLELAGVVVSHPAKVGVDAGKLCGLDPVGVAATNDNQIAFADDIDCVVYAATADTRIEEATGELLGLLGAGRNVVSTSFYPLLHPAHTHPILLPLVDDVTTAGNTSVFVSGIDPGWVMDILPVFLSGVCADITEIRAQEVFNYAYYDQPEIVREVVGFGTSMDETPPMLLDVALLTVWAPMLRVVADGLGLELDDITTEVERRPLTETVEVDGMGTFEAGTQGAFRFEVQGWVDGQKLLVVEHITRIDDRCAPDWPSSPEKGGVHRVKIAGRPNLEVTVHGNEEGEPAAAGGGNATAANRIVNAIPAVVAAAPGIVSPLDLPAIDGRHQIRKAAPNQ